MFQNIAELPELAAMIDGGYITERKHPSAPLLIYNYTAKAQYDTVWNDATLSCRGLICDTEGNVVARPFRKFFNLEQVESLPDEPFEVYEKMDGSLGILYWWKGEPCIATRGSFDSEQARFATAWAAKNRSLFDGLRRDRTYLFEIIYPSNRIVVNYGGAEFLALLAAIDTATGREFPIDDLGFCTPARYEGVTSVQDLKRVNWSNAEGFVIRFAGGLRVKVKMEEYVRLHKLLTGISEKRILEDFLVPGNDIRPLLERVPDEFYDWVRGTVDRFLVEFAKIEMTASAEMDQVTQQGCRTRKEYAAAFTKSPNMHILFRMLDGKNYSNLIWKRLAPNASAFRMGEE